MSLLPNVTIIGDQRGGGGGLPVSKQLSNAWVLTYTSSIVSLPNGFIIEDGILPDLQVATGEAEEAMGIDSIIEAAIMALQ